MLRQRLQSDVTHPLKKKKQTTICLSLQIVFLYFFSFCCTPPHFSLTGASHRAKPGHVPTWCICWSPSTFPVMFCRPPWVEVRQLWWKLGHLGQARSFPLQLLLLNQHIAAIAWGAGPDSHLAWTNISVGNVSVCSCCKQGQSELLRTKGNRERRQLWVKVIGKARWCLIARIVTLYIMSYVMLFLLLQPASNLGLSCGGNWL